MNDGKRIIEQTIGIITENGREFIIYGDDDFAARFYGKYKDEISFVGFFGDDSITKSFLLEEKFFTLDELKEKSDNKIIVVAKRRNKDIREADEYLESIGKEPYRDFFNSKFFEAVYDAYIYNRTVLNFVEMTITERCTLRCKDCSQFMPYFENPTHTELNRILKDIDTLFDTVGYTFHFRLLGGETFIHPNIREIISYVVDNYRDRIDFFDIATNGTVMPEPETLLVCAEGNVTVSISDYGLNDAYTKRVDELVSLLERFKVDYRRNRFEFWYNIGFPRVKDETLTDDQKISLFEECKCEWRNYHDGRIYFCSVCASAIRAGLIEGFNTDYFDIRTNVDKKKLLMFDMGINGIGYNSLCGLCKGYMPSANREHVVPGTQMCADER